VTTHSRILIAGLIGTTLGSMACAGPGHSGGDDAAVASGVLPDGGVSSDGGAALITIGDGATQGSLTILPAMPVVTVITGQAVPTVQFSALLGGIQTGAMWSIDRGEIGTIDQNGLFTPAGSIGGVGTVTAASGVQVATTTVTVDIQTTQQGDPAWTSPPPPPGAGGYGGVGGDGPGAPPSAAQMSALGGAPVADATVSFLYPYDGTVWPQGLLAPLLQWNPGAHSFDAVYLHIQEKGYEYKGYFAANATPFMNLPIPQPVWDALTVSNGGDPVTISLLFAQGGSLFGPYAESWTIAHAKLQGTIYYNSYGTSLVKNSATDGLDNYGKQYGAATLAIAPRATFPTLTAGINSINPTGDGSGCRVCHTVSANGKTLVTQGATMSAGDYSNTVYIDLQNDTTGGAGTSLQNPRLAFPALFKDGSLLFSSAGGMIDGDNSSRLYALPAGTPVAGVSGLPAGLQAALPAFSPDGQHVSFNFWGGSFSSAVASDRISLAILDFDGKTAFSNPRVVYTPPVRATGQPSVTFSSFLPNGTGIVFDLELTNPSGTWGFTWQQNTSELWWVDVTTGTAHRLDQLNGYDKTGNLYLPDNARGAATHTSAQDATVNYEPTVCPIAAGGYAWIVFTSRRMYGSVAQLGPWVSDPRRYPWLDQITDKKLWVAAVDLNAAPGTDPSHPAFYLPAQELHAGNSRGFWSFESCRPDLQNCETGAQCCGGYCQATGAGLSCTSNVPKCSAEYDKCTTSSDCCAVQNGILCINGVCSRSKPF
jgi:hypothetical protein